MKNSINHMFPFLWKSGLSVLLLLCFVTVNLSAQDEEASASTKKPVKNMFESVWIIDNQTSVVPIKGTFEMDIQHRFGTWDNGYDDFWGIYAPSNIRLGFNYAPINKLYVGFGFTKFNMYWDFNAKYAILEQMKGGGSPIALTYFGNFAFDGRPDATFANTSDRFSYFNQLIIARKFTDALSVQVAPSLSWFNVVDGYLDENGDVQKKMDNLHFAIAFSGRYKVSEKLAILVNVDQPLTQHPTSNPHPNVSFGLEIATSSHAFQVFAGNYQNIVQQRNNMFNQNDYTNSQFLIGFNITRLWNF